jgi:hypothetical protein
MTQQPDDYSTLADDYSTLVEYLGPEALRLQRVESLCNRFVNGKELPVNNIMESLVIDLSNCTYVLFRQIL